MLKVNPTRKISRNSYRQDKALERWGKLRDYVKAECYKLLIPKEDYERYQTEKIQLRMIEGMLHHLEAKERVFMEKQIKVAKEKLGSTLHSFHKLTPRPEDVSQRNHVYGTKLAAIQSSLAADRLRTSFSNFSRLPSTTLHPDNVIPTESLSREHSGEYDFEKDENVKLEDVKSLKTHNTKKITKSGEIYSLACRKCGVIPMSHYKRQLQKSAKVTLSNCKLTPEDMKPICISLVNDKKVHTLDLSSNKLGPIGIMYISEMLIRNSSIRELDLSGTYPGREGLDMLADALEFNVSMRVLKLVGNGIEHTELDVIVKIMEKCRLQELYLGHNALGYEGGTLLANSLATNTSLKVLDLQWNHIRRQSAVNLCKALADNKCLCRLNLEWNGLGKEGCMALAKSLPKNTTLLELNINSNRIDMASLRFLLHGLVYNKRLKRVFMGRNPITTDGAKAVIRAIRFSKVSCLEEIGLVDIPVDEEFLTLVKNFGEDARSLHAVHGEVLSKGLNIKEREHDPHDLNRFDPVMVLVEYMRIDNLRLIDFFAYLDTSNREMLSKSDLRGGVANLGIPLTEHHLDLIMEKVDLKKDGFIDLEEFMTVQRETQRVITNRTTKARQKTGKEDEGLTDLRKIIKEIIEKRNKSNKEKASNREPAPALSDNSDKNRQRRTRVVTKDKTFSVTQPNFSQSRSKSKKKTSS